MTIGASLLQYSGAATDPCSRSESGYPFCSSISVKAAEGFDVGMYTCSHAISPHYPGPKNDTAQEEVYVYVRGVQFLITFIHSDDPYAPPEKVGSTTRWARWGTPFQDSRIRFFSIFR